MLGEHFKEQNHKQKEHKCKNVVLNMTKGTLFWSMRDETRRQSITLFNLSQKCAHWTIQFFTILFATCPQMTTKAPQVLVWGLQINFCEKAIINLELESQNNEINYVFYFIFSLLFWVIHILKMSLNNSSYDLMLLS